jgi:hypothetical protein
MPISAIAAIGTTAKASLISHKSTSEIEDAFAAVTVPSLLKAGFR